MSYILFNLIWGSVFIRPIYEGVIFSNKIWLKPSIRTQYLS